MNILMSSQSKKITHCPTHSHSCYELIVVTKGECFTIVNNISYKMQKGAVMIIPPHTMHSELSDGYYSDIYIQYNNNELFADLPLLIADYSLTIAKLADIIKNLFIKNDFNSREICNSLLSSIFSYISTLIKENYTSSLVPILKNTIVENLSNTDFNISKSVESIGYNIDYASRIFKKNIGQTPNSYLTHIRIEAAKRLLINCDHYSIKEIAFQCGFSDQYYFSRIFKKQTGCPPSKYKEFLRKSENA